MSQSINYFRYYTRVLHLFAGGAILGLTWTAAGDDVRVIPPADAREASSEVEWEGAMEEKTVIETVRAHPDLQTFGAILEANGYGHRLGGYGMREAQWTVFAPADSAFEHIDDDLLQRLVSGEHQAAAAEIVESHLMRVPLTINEIEGEPGLFNNNYEGLEVEHTMPGETVVRVEGKEAAVTERDIESSQGFVHVVDDLLAEVTADLFEPGAGVPGRGDASTRE